MLLHEDELGGGLLLPRTSASSGLVSIVLSGAELAALDLSHLQLFWSSSSSASSVSSQGGNETRIELRRKSGVVVESPVIVPASVFELSRIDCDDAFAASDSAVAEEQQSPGSSSKLRLFGSESSAAVSPIVLKSRAVIDAEKGTKQQQQAAPPAEQERAQQQAGGWRRKHKQRAVSMDEASLGILDHPKKQSSSSSKDDLSAAILQRSREITSSKASSRPPMPLPLPLPPPLEIPQGDEQQQRKKQQHRRHLSIDLRASPAAKFVVKVMPWELPRRSPSSPLATAAAAAAEGTPQSCFVPFKWEDAPGKPKLLRTKEEEQRFFRHHHSGDHHQPPLRLPPRLQADLSHHKQQQQIQHHSSSLWPSIHARGHKTSRSSTAIAAVAASDAAATSPTSILDAAATESTPSSCAASVSSPNAADETAARGKCVEPQGGGFCVISPCKELAPEEEQQQQQRIGNGNSSSIQGKLRAFFAWQVWHRLVLGKKKGKSESDLQEEQHQQKQLQQCESYDNFDELLQRNNRRKKKKKRRNRINVRAPADHHSSSNKNGYNAQQDYSLRSPSPMVFSWFASPLQVRQRDNIGQRAFTRIAASCNVLKKVVIFKRLRWCHHRRRMHLKPKSSRTKSIYRPLLCRVDADSSAAFACSSSSTI